MSGGTPDGGGYMRQRHSQGYASSGDDLEDDACSRPISTSPSFSKNRKWVEVLENLLWIASAIFIIYYGDQHSNFIYLLRHDDRIRRFCFALWPIWSFLTLPLVFTLFMACMVILPYLVLGTFKKQTDSFRTD